jgi:hypothetical protein
MGWAARAHGVACTIVVPKGNSAEKNDAMRALGVQLIEHGDDFQESREHAMHLATERGAHMVPSFHKDLLRGVSTYWWEFLRAVPQLDVVYVPIGQGSGACSAIAAKLALGHRGAHRGRGQRTCHHLRRLAGGGPGGRGAGQHRTGRRHGLPRGRCRAALAVLAAPRPCGEGQRRRSGAGHALAVCRHPQRGRRRGCSEFCRGLAGAGSTLAGARSAPPCVAATWTAPCWRGSAGRLSDQGAARGEALDHFAEAPTASVLKTTSRTPAALAFCLQFVVDVTRGHRHHQRGADAQHLFGHLHTRHAGHVVVGQHQVEAVGVCAHGIDGLRWSVKAVTRYPRRSSRRRTRNTRVSSSSRYRMCRGPASGHRSWCSLSRRAGREWAAWSIVP